LGIPRFDDSSAQPVQIGSDEMQSLFNERIIESGFFGVVMNDRGPRVYVNGDIGTALGESIEETEGGFVAGIH
jgi:hypothetical protein